MQACACPRLTAIIYCHVIAIVQWLESFEKVRVLGVGGTGVVYELLHKLNGKKCAMKEMEIKNKAQMQMAMTFPAQTLAHVLIQTPAHDNRNHNLCWTGTIRKPSFRWASRMCICR